MKNLNRDIEEVCPEKYKFLDLYESLRKSITKRLQTFSQEEYMWFNKTLEIQRTITESKKKKIATLKVPYLQAIPEIVKNKDCAGILYCLLKEPGIKIADIASNMAKYTRPIQRARKKLETLGFIVVH